MPVNIHGKEYKTVAERVNEIHELDKMNIETEMISWVGGLVIFKATVTTDKGVFNGHAYEVETAKGINQTSALENCETSAVGRALAFAGYAGSEIASANEVQQAIHQQEKVVEVTAGVFADRLRAAKDAFGAKSMTGLFKGYLKEHYGTDNEVEIVKNHLKDADKIIKGLNSVYQEGLK